MDHPSLSPDELHLLYILLDSNLPTGGFVSSSGLEAYVKHGFLGLASAISPYNIDPSRAAPVPGHGPGTGDTNGSTFTAVKGVKDVIRGVTDFAEAEVGHYGATTGCFVKDSWRSVQRYMEMPCQSRHTDIDKDGHDIHTDTDNDNVNVNFNDETEKDRDAKEETSLKRVIREITDLDEYHESAMLSHVARRASKAQGVAMLTLFTRGLSRPVGYEPLPLSDLGIESHTTDTSIHARGEMGADVERVRVKEERSMAIVSEYKRLVRKGSVPGHLAVCWGVITATLGLALDRSIHLYLFLHARSLLSTAVRMNIIGPYASSQMLLHPFKRIIEVQTSNLTREEVTTGLFNFARNHNDDADIEEKNEIKTKTSPEVGEDKEGVRSEGEGDGDDLWSWTTRAELGPATTWPLGEVLMARHDMQHSRIFNS